MLRFVDYAMVEMPSRASVYKFRPDNPTFGSAGFIVVGNSDTSQRQESEQARSYH